MKNFFNTLFWVLIGAIITLSFINRFGKKKIINNITIVNKYNDVVIDSISISDTVYTVKDTILKYESWDALQENKSEIK